MCWFDSVKSGCVGLDVQQGGTIENVDVVKMQNVVLSLEKSDDAQADVVWSAGCAGGENTTFRVIKERLDQEVHGIRSMKIVDQIYVRESFDVA